MQLAQEYGRWSTGLEIVNTIGDVFLGKSAGALRTTLSKNKDVAAKVWFKKFFQNPYSQSIFTEGATEFSQEFTSEVKKKSNVPEYNINYAQMMESFFIGGIYGGGFRFTSQTVNYLADGRKPPIDSSDDRKVSHNKSKQDIQKPTVIDNDIIVGYHSNPNFANDIADEYEGVTKEQVMLRFEELTADGQLEGSNARATLRNNPGILNKYPSWSDPFVRKEVEDDGLPQGDNQEDVDSITEEQAQAQALEK